MKKKILILFFVLFLSISILPAGALAGDAEAFTATEVFLFNDVAPDAWYYNAVKNAAQNKYMAGVSDHQFAPEEAVTKGMLARILYGIEYSAKTEASDAESSLWSNNAIDWAVANSIMAADENGVLDPENNLTRQEMTMMFQHYAKYQGRSITQAAELSVYADAGSVAAWAHDSMSWAISAGLIDGVGDSSLSPGSFATRAQVAQVLMRYSHGVTLEKRTSDYVSQFVEGNFNDFYADSAEQLQNSITPADLSNGWYTIVQAIGLPEKTLGSIYTKLGSQDIVVSLASCTLYNIKVTVIYGSDGKPIGIWTGYEPKDPPMPQSGEKWEEIPVTVGDKPLPGMLTLPKDVQKPPVIILIQGSGSSDMNEAIGIAPNRPFEDIAHGLAEEGIATLRYNKRTYQYPADGGDTIEYEMLNDAAAAIELLVNEKRVDGNRIYLLGHSLGGMMAPKIADDNPEIKGFVSMAGSLRTLQDIILDQNKAALATEATLAEEQKNALLAQVEVEIEKTKTLNDDGTGYIMGVPTSYWESLNAIDGLAIVERLNIPMLILQGSADFQVSQEKDYTLWQDTLAGRTNVIFKLYDDLSHLFMPNQIPINGALDISVYNAPNHVDPQVIKDIASWIDKQ